MPTVTLVSLPSQNRVGSFLTGTYAVPVAAIGTLQIMSNMTVAVATNSLNSLWLRIYRFDEGVWKHVASTDWRGNPTGDPAGLEISMFDLAGKQIRGELDIPASMKVGCTISLVT
jgi:hypothetical protein